MSAINISDGKDSVSGGALPTAIFLMGPTASGKTSLAVELIKHLPCDIISVDSSLVYKGMDIGTAKPDKATLTIAPHRLIDIRDPSEPYSSADFRRDALREMRNISASGRIPLLVGGSMLYFKVLRDGIAPLPEADQQIRAKIQADADLHGWHKLHEQLNQYDPVAAEKIHPNNPQRLMRAIEVYEQTGIPLGVHWQKQGEDKHSDTPVLPYRVFNFAVVPDDRSELHARIELRFRQMLEQNFIQEAEHFFNRGDLTKDLPSMRAVGYRQAWEYLEGITSYDEMVRRGIASTRQLAKRQLTWLRKWPDLHRLQMGETKLYKDVLKKLLCTAI